MKKKGSKCDYIAHRNEALVRQFKKEIHQADIIDLDSIFRRISRSAAPRFFISESRAFTMIRHKKRSGSWEGVNKLRLSMLEEIERRTDQLMKADKTLTMEEAVYEAVNSEAPCFYLTPGSIRTIIYETLK